MEQVKDWREVVMPDSIAALPRDKRGYPIPANVLRNNGKPVFAANNARWEMEAIRNGWCSITGTLLRDDDVWLICGPGSALHPCGMVFDHPVCGEAKDYSMRVCPYLAIPGYAGLPPEAKTSMAAKFGALNDPSRPWQKMEQQVALNVRGLRIALHPEQGTLYLPTRDYRRVEIWSEGSCRASYEGAAVRELLDQNWPDGIPLEGLPSYFREAHKGTWSGVFPWTGNNRKGATGCTGPAAKTEAAGNE